MLDPLEAADRGVELNPILGVAHGELERCLGRAAHLGRHGAGAAVEDPADRRPGASGRAQKRALRNSDGLEAQPTHALGEIHRREILYGESHCIALHHRERHLFGGGSRPERHHEERRTLRVGNEELLAREQPGIPVALARELDSRRLERVALLEEGEGPDL